MSESHPMMQPHLRPMPSPATSVMQLASFYPPLAPLSYVATAMALDGYLGLSRERAFLGEAARARVGAFREARARWGFSMGLPKTRGCLRPRS